MSGLPGMKGTLDIVLMDCNWKLGGCENVCGEISFDHKLNWVLTSILSKNLYIIRDVKEPEERAFSSFLRAKFKKIEFC